MSGNLATTNPAAFAARQRAASGEQHTPVSETTPAEGFIEAQVPVVAADAGIEIFGLLLILALYLLSS